MKKIVSATDLGGAPFFKNDLRDVFNSEIWGAMEALLSPFNSDTEGIIVSGCVISANGSNFDMTSGIVYLDGNFMRVPAATNVAFTRYIAPDTAVQDSRTFADQTTHAVVETKTAGLYTVTGSGQYITISSLTSAEDRRFSKFLNDSGWITVSSFNQGSVIGTGVAYRKFNNIVYLRGAISVTLASYNPTNGMFTIPAGFRPVSDTYINNTQLPDSSFPGLAIVTEIISSTGRVGGVDLSSAGTTDVIHLNGVSFFID